MDKGGFLHKALVRILILNLIILLLGMGIFSFPQKTSAAALTRVYATPANVATGATTNYRIDFKTATSIAKDGKILVQFPNGFNVAGANFVSWTGFDGGRSVGIAGQVVTITRDNTGNAATPGDKSIVLGNIVNTAVVANNYQVTVTTKTNGGGTLDGPTLSLYFQIFAGNVPTTIDGTYYLISTAQSHYQNLGNGIGSKKEIGSFSKTNIASSQDRGSPDYYSKPLTIFYFDENGSYNQTNHISNIYYRVWYNCQTNGTGNLGYETKGNAASGGLDASYALTEGGAAARVNGYYLTAHKQDINLDIYGNAIYDFSIKYVATDPVVYSSPIQKSFIYINLPADGVLQAQDTDSDGLKDYAELFTYYTDPNVADTDGDTYSDKFEIDHAMNPNDPEKAPVLGKNYNPTKSYLGEAQNNSFGWQVSSIGDLDGDGKEDIIVGAPFAGTGGAVYLYSSASGQLLRKFSSLAAGAAFGYGVSRINDMDGNGKEEVIISAIGANPGVGAQAGAVYIYSSTSGNLLKQFSGEAAGDQLGYTPHAIGDQNGDGKQEVLVGARYADFGGIDKVGSAYIFSTATGNILQKYNGTADNDQLGHCVAPIGDQNGDGKEDVLIGAPLTDPGGINKKGTVYLYTSTGNFIRSWDGENLEDEFGWSVSAIGDQNNDGKEDVLAGTETLGTTSTGLAYIYSSSTGVLIRKWQGEVAKDTFGVSVARITDQDGDNKEEAIIGATGSASGGKLEGGAAYLYSGGSGNLLKKINSPTLMSAFGIWVSQIGDVDNDNKADILSGAYWADPGGKENAGAAYLYGSGEIPDQTWVAGSSPTTVLDLDNYFYEPNNLNLPNPNETLTYSVTGNSNIDISINAATHEVSFSAPTCWAGTEDITFYATDPHGLQAESNEVTLTVTGTNTCSSGASDTTPPSLSISYPYYSNWWTYGNSIPIRAMVSDSESGIDRVWLYNQQTEETVDIVQINPDGYFEQWLDLQDNAKNVIQVKAQDKTGNLTTKELNIYQIPLLGRYIFPESTPTGLGTQAVTFISIFDDILDKEIDLSKTTQPIIYTQIPTFKGTTIPEGSVDLYISSSQEIHATVMADIAGNWEYQLTQPLDYGQHSVYAMVTDKDGNVSQQSDKLTFTIKNPSEMPLSSKVEKNLREFQVWWIFAGIAVLLLSGLVVFYLKTRKKKFNLR